MPTRPLLPLPAPSPVELPKGPRAVSSIRYPAQTRQVERFGPLFARLRSALGRPGGSLQLREDPTSLAPERVIVFEIAGNISDFIRAISRIEGLEFMAEYEGDFEADDDFRIQDQRRGREGQTRNDKSIPGRYYLAMPDVRAFQELLSLWEKWERGEELGRGYTPFTHLFKQLRAIRPWGAQDRIPNETIEFWQEEFRRNPDKPIRTEIELWYRENNALRHAASQRLQGLVAQVGGAVVHEAVIGEIAYHGMLVDIPAGEVQNLAAHRDVQLALADEVMFLRPQSLLQGPLTVEPEPGGPYSQALEPSVGRQPIAALIDGVPLQAHRLLAGRLLLDDPDNLQARAVVSHRVHGTAMASLILHGDRNEAGDPLSRPLYVRPLLAADNQGCEQTEPDRLLVDTLYRAIVRLKGSEGQVATAPTVFLINLSLGDTRRPFTRLISPLARLLDFLSYRYGILFLVSAGNVPTPLDINDYQNWTEFEAATGPDRERAVLKALNAAKHERSILSPAESLNALTIGAHHHDGVEPRMTSPIAIDPFLDSTLPNVTSALGLGHRRMIKPELYFPGGREHVRMRATGNGLQVSIGAPQRLYGLRAAAPDPSGQGRLDHDALSDGTSSATALATRTAHRIFDALMDREGGSLLADIDPSFYAVVVKALLVHGARWNGNHELLKEICGPEGRGKHVQRADNSSRFIGFGIVDASRVFECAPNRATLVGYGALLPENAHSYRIPLPACLERVTDPRSLSVTIAWFSPIKSGHQSYRCLRFEAAPLHKPVEAFGVERSKSQPADASVKRGSVFHEHYTGSKAVPYMDDGHLGLRIWCKEDAGIADSSPVRYGIAVTIESETPLTVYEEIQNRLRIRLRPR